MSDKIITISNVSKTYTFSKRQGLKGFLKPDRSEVVAVDNVSLDVEKGESVAFIGPNGAGKSTTIKMLCGILQTSHGSIRVLGLDPLKQRRQLAYRIGTVFGQRSQLLFNLPLLDTLKLTADMYGLDHKTIDKRIDEVIAQFNLSDFIQQPVRKLSLGQRMRAEIANSLLHNPDIIFLDEPTIGLDVVSKRSLRQVIKETNRQRGTTIFLTSHDVGDIEEVCGRTVIVNHGKIVLDTPSVKLKKNYLQNKVVRVVLSQPNQEVKDVLGIAAKIAKGGIATFSVDTSEYAMNKFLPALLKTIEVDDITIENTPLEDIIHDLYVRQNV